MKIISRSSYFILLLLFVCCHCAMAHHSHGNYEIGTEITIEGVVSEVLLRNPHVWVFVEVQSDNGNTAVWGLESGGIASFKRLGQENIAVGDTVSTRCTPARDGENGCFMITIDVINAAESEVASKDWIHYTDTEQMFKVNFPAEPTVRKAPYPSEYGAIFPSTVYEVNASDSLYSLIVVDFSDAKERYIKLAETINVAGGHNFWLYDQMGAIAYAARQFRLRGGEVTYDAWHHVDFIGGHQLFITNPDESRTYAGIYRHADRLYILEATVPADAPPQGIFQQSLSVLDEEGKNVRYKLQPDHSRVRVDPPG